jgi:hypothetical protein
MNPLPLLQNARHIFRDLARRFCILICLAISTHPVTVPGQRIDQRSRSALVTVNITPNHPANRFMPSHALGAGIDGHDKGVADLQLSAPNIQAMLSAGFKSLTYRLRTELAGDAWHWNPRGRWSDTNNRQGYWVSNSEPAAEISLSYGYRLPRRGNTIDQANDEGYSRLDDGDLQSFWKSNPYLDRQFTGESNSLHPQWIVIEFEKPLEINAVRILWGEPFAERYRIQYGNFDDVSDIALSSASTWRDFPHSEFVGGANYRKKSRGDLLRVANDPIRTRWLRVEMIESSGTTTSLTNDIRDRVGFAVREVYAGTIDQSGNFHDRIHHAADRRRQTIIHVSSTDPWHRETDLDTSVEQPGLDRTFHSGLTNDLPALLPTGLAYDTPENAANEIRYLRQRGYRFDRIELGEEPDGQYITPDDFGALYLQWADAIHRVDPNVKLGGPSFQEIMPDDEERPVRLGNSEWMRRFLDYLKRHGRTSDYSFFSFEWYPFDDVCAPVAPQLTRAPKLLENALREMERRGLSRQLPWIMSEYGYSAFAARAEIGIEGALLNADIVGKFLTLGGDQAFLFGYSPGMIGHDFPCTAGGIMMFSMDEDGDIRHRFATYFGARLLTQQWLQPGNGVHEIYPAASDVRNAKGEEVVTAYPVHRPDGMWSVLLINKDPQRSFETNVIFHEVGSRSSGAFEGSLDVYQYSGRQYLLGGSAKNPYPVKADEPEHRVIETSRLRPAPIALPPYSLTVVRGGTSPFGIK